MPHKRPHPRATIIAYIWIGTVAAGYLFALFSQDSDPYTDEGAAAGALIAVVGSALTVGYRAVAKGLNSRTAAIRGEEDGSPLVETGGRMRRNSGPLAASVAAIVVLAIATALAPPPDTQRGQGRDVPDGRPTHVPNKGVLIARVTAAADAASPGRITSVDCEEPLAFQDTFVVSCAVTFEGPACQLWMLASAVDEPVSVGDPVDGRRGSTAAQMAHCE